MYLHHIPGAFYLFHSSIKHCQTNSSPDTLSSTVRRLCKAIEHPFGITRYICNFKPFFARLPRLRFSATQHNLDRSNHLHNTPKYAFKGVLIATCKGSGYCVVCIVE